MSDADNTLQPIVYEELHRLAESCFRGQRSDHTLQPTALVHEAFLRLQAQDNPRWNSRKHFLCVAAKAMRQILVNHARDRNRQKRAGSHERVPLTVALAELGDEPTDVAALDEALEQLAALDERKARIVELRYFAGLSVLETAEVLELSRTTVKDEWSLARAWLFDKLGG